MYLKILGLSTLLVLAAVVYTPVFGAYHVVQGHHSGWPKISWKDGYLLFLAFHVLRLKLSVTRHASPSALPDSRSGTQ